MSNNKNLNSLPYDNSIDQDKLQHFKEKAMSDLDGAWNAALVYIGDKLGLYRALKDAGKPITSLELATITKSSERNVREWLANQAAGSYVTYDANTQEYSLPRENAFMLVDGNSPEYIIGAFQTAKSFYKDASKIMDGKKKKEE